MEVCSWELVGGFSVDFEEHKYSSAEKFAFYFTKMLLTLPGDPGVEEYKRLIKDGINDDKNKEYQLSHDKYDLALKEGERLLSDMSNILLLGRDSIKIVQVSLKSRQAYLTNLIRIYSLGYNVIVTTSPVINKTGQYDG